MLSIALPFHSPTAQQVCPLAKEACINNLPIWRALVEPLLYQPEETAKKGKVLFMCKTVATTQVLSPDSSRPAAVRKGFGRGGFGGRWPPNPPLPSGEPAQVARRPE